MPRGEIGQRARLVHHAYKVFISSQVGQAGCPPLLPRFTLAEDHPDEFLELSRKDRPKAEKKLLDFVIKESLLSRKSAKHPFARYLQDNVPLLFL